MSADDADELAEAVEDLTWRDYVAMALALGQTVLLPFVLVVLVLLVLFLLSLVLL